jgi:hypothetical protein
MNIFKGINVSQVCPLCQSLMKIRNHPEVFLTEFLPTALKTWPSRASVVPRLRRRLVISDKSGKHW